MSRLAPKQETIRALFALSGNQCAFPGCSHLLISNKGTFIAQLCHIEAANKGGQRFNPNQSEEERRSQSNLLLLCYAHHRETDDEDEYTRERLWEMKKAHEEQFKNQYELPESLVEKVLGSIQVYLEQIFAISKDTNIVVHAMEEKVNELLRRTEAPSDYDDKLYISQLEFIKELKNQGNYKTAIDRYIDFKEKNWEKIKPELKYKVLANLGMCYLDLHDKINAGKYLVALAEIPYKSADSLAILCLGYAITGKNKEFDACFSTALNEGSDNINLWVAYIERHSKSKNTDKLLKEIPAAVADSVPVLFSIGGIMIEEGRKKEGIDLLKATLEKQEEVPEKKADSRALIATRILQDIVDPFKFMYNHFSDDELQALEEAKTLLTEAWNVIGKTEMASFKWYIILNLGVINKLTRQNNQAVLDFQKAFDISREFLPFKNLLMMYMQVGNLSMAEQLLENPGIFKPLSEEELFEMQTFKARLLCLQGRFKDGLGLLINELDESKEKRYIEIVTVIIATCYENNSPQEAMPWCEKLLQKFPELITTHLLSGYLWTKMDDKQKALSFYNKAQTLLAESTRNNEIYELASGYMDLEEYEKAIPLFERLADKNRLNTFSRGLIHAYFQYGDLQAALAIAENLLLQNPGHVYLVEIISTIHQETRQFDKAIAIIRPFLGSTHGRVKDVFSYRLAKLYSFNRDWENAKHFALQVSNFEHLSMVESFGIAGILVNAGEVDKALSIAFDIRTRFFDNSAAHLKYTQVCIAAEKEENDLFPDIVRSDCAVIFKTETEEEKTFIITEKNAKGENVIKPHSPFALQSIGKKKGQKITIEKGYGFSTAITITAILELYTHAFQESMRFFETRFAGEQNVGVFHADPGQPGDQLEQFIRESTQERNDVDKQIYQLYNQRKVTIGVVARLFKRNAVIQWFNLLSSSEVFIYSFSKDEYPAAHEAIQGNKPVVLDLTSLLSMFFISKDTNYFTFLTNKCLVSQSTIDELKECSEELERGSKDGIFTVRYEEGQMVGNNISAETIQRHREILEKVIAWCKANASIITPSKLLEVRREERERMSDILGTCFYDCLLLAEEHNAVVISDDDNFKNLLRSSNRQAPFSTYQLVHYIAGQGKITHEQFDLFRLQIILSNYIFVPVSAEQLWQCFDASGFKLTKPFIVAVKGLIVMKPEFSSLRLAQFLKKLYLEAGLAISRNQTILYILNDVSNRNDFEEFKRMLVLAVENEFSLLPIFKEDFFQLLKAF